MRHTLHALATALLSAGLAAGQERSDKVEALVYKKTAQADLEMTVHYPPGWQAGDKRPAIVFFFGGGWNNGKLTQFEPQARYLAERGMVTARADYRVKSRHGIGPAECVQDARSAVRWLRQNATRLGIDPEHIAACTALSRLEPAGEDSAVSSRPSALVLFNPVLRFSGVPKLMDRIDGDEDLGKKISPTLHLAKDSPPALILFGTSDELLEQAAEFMKRSRALGHRAELYTAPEQPHGFFNRSPWQERTLYRVDEFLGSLGYLKGAPTLKQP
jgi:acetyl esterase